VLKNKNRGYQQLRVCQDAIEFYKLNSEIFCKVPYELKRIASQAIASSDSVHRNIAEGYCRRSIKRYLNFLNIALGCWVKVFQAYTLTMQLNRSLKTISRL
jgi:hypothetical protein